jgi:hypothetical protein
MRPLSISRKYPGLSTKYWKIILYLLNPNWACVLSFHPDITHKVKIMSKNYPTFNNENQYWNINGFATLSEASFLTCTMAEVGDTQDDTSVIYKYITGNNLFCHK